MGKKNKRIKNRQQKKGKKMKKKMVKIEGRKRNMEATGEESREKRKIK